MSDMARIQSPVSVVINLLVLQNVGKFLSS
jgi:hypothetical protein